VKYPVTDFAFTLKGWLW